MQLNTMDCKRKISVRFMEVWEDNITSDYFTFKKKKQTNQPKTWRMQL